MKNKYAPLLLSRTGKTIVLLGAAGLLAAGIVGVHEVRSVRVEDGASFDSAIRLG